MRTGVLTKMGAEMAPAASVGRIHARPRPAGSRTRTLTTVALWVAVLAGSALLFSNVAAPRILTLFL